MRRHSVRLIPVVLLLAPLDGALAADAERGRELATTCTVCHGPNGDAINPTVPRIAGQNDLYLIKAMKDFRDGARKDPSMTAIFRRTSDEDIEDLAAWFNSIEVQVMEQARR